MAYKTKTLNGVEYQIRFATFKPKTFAESAKAMQLDEGGDHTDDIQYALDNGIEVEALVPVAESLVDIGTLVAQNIYSEKYIVDCFVHGIAIKEQAKSRMQLENLARPKKSKLTKELYNVLFNKITPNEWETITTADNKAKALQDCIDIHFELHQNKS